MSKIVFITGASSGFGKAIAEHLSSKGFRVYGTSRKPDCTASYATMLKMDVKNANSIRGAVQLVLGKEGRIDVLVNNAGISTIGPLEESPIELVNDIMETNLNGLLQVCQAILPSMRDQQSGLIINISSIGGLIGLPYRGLYAASKFAVEGLTESLSMEVKPFGIVVCMVEPGDFNTEMSRNRRSIQLASDSVYASICASLEKVADEQMKNAPGPEAMGELIFRIINSDKVKLRYKIGSFFEKLAPKLKLILPARTFERIVMAMYKL